MSKEDAAVTDIEPGLTPGLIVRHTNRRLGKLGTYESCERLISGSISFSEFVDQVEEGYGELLDFMMEHDLHPGRPEDVFYSINFHAASHRRAELHSQLSSLYNQQGRAAG